MTVEISRSTFERFMDNISRQLNCQWEEVENKQSGEVIYDLTGGNLPDELSVRIFSTISKRTGKSRNTGTDSIKTVLIHTPSSDHVGGKKRTNRIETWDENLREKVEDLVKNYDDVGTICEECDSWMVLKSGPYGKFLGCSQYPDCENKVSLD